MSATFTTLPVEEGSTILTTSPTVFKRGSKRRIRFVITKDAMRLSNDDKKRALSVVAECPFGRSGTLRTTVKGSRLRSLEPSPERFAFWCANESQSDSSTLCPRRVQVSTPKQEVVRESKILVIPKISDFRTTLSSTSEGRVAPSAVGQGSSPLHEQLNRCTQANTATSQYLCIGSVVSLDSGRLGYSEGLFPVRFRASLL